MSNTEPILIETVTVRAIHGAPKPTSQQRSDSILQEALEIVEQILNTKRVILIKEEAEKLHIALGKSIYKKERISYNANKVRDEIRTLLKKTSIKPAVTAAQQHTKTSTKDLQEGLETIQIHIKSGTKPSSAAKKWYSKMIGVLPDGKTFNNPKDIRDQLEQLIKSRTK